ncbi:MAG: NAD(+)/NADH kinase [Thermoflexales bacterium]|nr:NAD(+)/NADH kinase [Thermoflexales bacterium]MDW8352696.1 NAD(+)/NADH kinase [Anaerolineae bacterium]
MIQAVGVLDHPKLPATAEVADEISAALRAWGVLPYRAKTWDTPALEAIMPQVDLIVVLGGDGSTLRAARVAAPHGVPVTAVNMGRLGFLSEMTPANWRETLRRMIAGDYWTEERIMIHAEAYREQTRLSAHEALNDVVVSRGTLARIVRLGVYVDGSRLTTFACDGLIVATPTGSTAYALAAGGPILPPTLQNFVLVPIAPHLSLDKPVVLSQGSTVEIVVHTDHQAILTADGQHETTLRDGDRVVVRASEHVAVFARVQPPSYFYRTLMARLKGEGCES